MQVRALNERKEIPGKEQNLVQCWKFSARNNPQNRKESENNCSFSEMLILFLALQLFFFLNFDKNVFFPMSEMVLCVFQHVKDWIWANKLLAFFDGKNGYSLSHLSHLKRTPREIYSLIYYMSRDGKRAEVRLLSLHVKSKCALFLWRMLFPQLNPAVPPNQKTISNVVFFSWSLVEA